MPQDDQAERFTFSALISALAVAESPSKGAGKSFNIWSAALFIRLPARQCGLEPGELVRVDGEVHLYRNHAARAEQQLRRTPQGEARLEIARRPASNFDYRIDDFAVIGYQPQAHVGAPVAL